MALVASSRVPLRSTLRVKNQISRSLLNYIKPQFSVTFLARFDLYHTTSAVLMAKKNKQEKKEKTKGKGTQQEEKTNGDELIEVKLPDVALIAGKMDRAVQRFERELAKLRTGRVTADMFSDLEVGSYGQLSHLAQVTMKNATTLSITTFDPSMAKDVSDAVRDCGMNLNPTTEGNTVIVVVPKPSKESRQALSKTVSRIAEKVRRL